MCSVEDSLCSIYFVNVRHSISVQKFFYGYNHRLLCQVEEHFVCGCVLMCGCAKRKTERRTSFSWRKVLPISAAGGAWRCSNIENDHISTNKKCPPFPRSVGASKLAARINTLHEGNRGSFNR